LKIRGNNFQLLLEGEMISPLVLKKPWGNNFKLSLAGGNQGKIIFKKKFQKQMVKNVFLYFNVALVCYNFIAFCCNLVISILLSPIFFNLKPTRHSYLSLHCMSINRNDIA